MMIRPFLFIGLLMAIILTSSGTVWTVQAESPKPQIVVGSKNFMENRLLAEMFAQLIESRTDITVTRRLGLAGTQVLFEALKTGAIDLYPEYTGTGLVSILGQPPTKNARTTLNRVRSEFLSRWNIIWISPLGFENSYALAVPRNRRKNYTYEPFPIS